MSMAGAVYGKFNHLFYLYTKMLCWTMTPYSYVASVTSPGIFHQDVYMGGLGYDSVFNWSNGVRPVINLKADVQITGGIGTANDPFVIDA